MEWWARIRDWAGWRLYAPASGSVLAHIVGVVAIAAIMGAASKSGPPRFVRPAPALTVTLVTEMTPPAPARTAQQPARPVEPPRTAPKDQSTALPPRKGEQANTPKTATTPSGVASAEAGGVYLGPSQPAYTGAPLGLRSLLETNPCSQVLERLRGDCSKKWEDIASTGYLLVTPSIEELQRLYPGFAPPRFGSCSKHMGCYSDYAGEWRSLNGARAVGAKSPMASGPGGLGGINDMVGRLAPPNPYHVDPGFGD